MISGVDDRLKEFAFRGYELDTCDSDVDFALGGLWSCDAMRGPERQTRCIRRICALGRVVDIAVVELVLVDAHDLP